MQFCVLLHCFVLLPSSVSELRMVELLDDLCSAMSHYKWIPNAPRNGSDRENGAGWVLKSKQPKGSGSLSRAEEEIRAKQLKSYCGMIIEEHEENIVHAIRHGYTEGGE